MREEKIGKGKRFHWRVKVLLSIFISVITIVILLFGITYVYFEKKLEDNNQKIAEATFKQAERELKKVIGTIEGQVNRYVNLLLPWEFVEGYYADDIEKTLLNRRIVKDFDSMMSINHNIYAAVALKRSGDFVMSTSEYRSGSDDIRIGKNLDALLKKAEKSYPYPLWVSKNEFPEKEYKAFEPFLRKSVLIGIKFVGEGTDERNAAFVLIGMDEKAVRKTYDSVSYNGSIALLSDQEGKIISASGEEFLGERFAKKEGFQTIEYRLGIFDWKLVNMIPKELYLKESNAVRRFGLSLGIITCLFILMAGLIWSRRYTRPIQYLMDRMKLVGRGNLEIDEPEKMGWEELDELNREFYLLVDKLRAYISDLQTAEREKAKEELLALQYQINPHFILGSINSIRWMATMTNNMVVANALEILAKILTPILRNSASVWNLRDELKFSADYVSMMNIRYGNTMEYRVICDEELYEEEFPRLILQPMIENCFIYGSDPVEKRVITVSIKKEEKMIVSIANSGVHMPDDRIKSLNEMISKRNTEHIGLSNVKKRLSILYKETADLWVESAKNGELTVQIRF